MVSLSQSEFEAARPLLELLPDPALLIGPDYLVVWRNAKAHEQYGSEPVTCHELTHGRAVPCNEAGEACPMQDAIRGLTSGGVLHSHCSKTQGPLFYRVLALAVEGGSILEIHHELGRELIHDDLTGLLRREHWFEIVRRDLALLRRIQRPYAVVFIDLDEFKKFNDAFGHLAGDEMLRQLGAMLAREVRTSDAPCRWGGEEFVLFLPGTTQAQAMQLAERVRVAVGALRIGTADGHQRITASLGVYAAPAALPLEEALERADRALYSAKRAGRNRVGAHGEPAGEGPLLETTSGGA